MSLIKDLKLTDSQVYQIVKDWYTLGGCSEIFQSEEGEDLEEYIENRQEEINF